MMWNKLLLTEFVIYHCCLVGLMLLVFEFYFFSFGNFPLFLYLSTGVHTTWLFGRRAGQWPKSAHFWKTRKYSDTVNASQMYRRHPSESDSAAGEPSLIRSSISLVILRDTVGFGSQTSQAATAPSLPLHWWFTTPWLGSSELLLQSLLVDEALKKVNVNTRMAHGKLGLRIPKWMWGSRLKPRKCFTPLSPHLISLKSADCHPHSFFYLRHFCLLLVSLTLRRQTEGGECCYVVCAVNCLLPGFVKGYQNALKCFKVVVFFF